MCVTVMFISSLFRDFFIEIMNALTVTSWWPYFIQPQIKPREKEVPVVVVPDLPPLDVGIPLFHCSLLHLDVLQKSTFVFRWVFARISVSVQWECLWGIPRKNAIVFVVAGARWLRQIIPTHAWPESCHVRKPWSKNATTVSFMTWPYSQLTRFSHETDQHEVVE